MALSGPTRNGGWSVAYQFHTFRFLYPKTCGDSQIIVLGTRARIYVSLLHPLTHSTFPPIAAKMARRDQKPKKKKKTRRLPRGLGTIKHRADEGRCREISCGRAVESSFPWHCRLATGGAKKLRQSVQGLVVWPGSGFSCRNCYRTAGQRLRGKKVTRPNQKIWIAVAVIAQFARTAHKERERRE